MDWNTLNNGLWGVLIPIIGLLGLFLTASTRFVQFRYFGKMFKYFLGEKSVDGISSYQAVVLSIGGRVGAGNIGGIGLAIAVGGPGAIFWMWVMALIGLAASFFENSLAQLYKRKHGDRFRGGPAYYIKYGLGEKWIWLAAIYSFLLILTFSVGFTATQSYALAQSFQDSFAFPPIATGLGIAAFVAYAIFGGLKRIVKFTDIMVPVMALAYVMCAIYVILINISDVPAAFATIFNHAFGVEQIVGGGLGIAIMQGVRRGIFSNEAGLGSAPNIAATADVKHPVNQGLAQSVSVFIDTIVICTATAMLILLSDVYLPGSEVNSMVYTQVALGQHLGSFGGIFVTIILFFFVFTSIMYNYYMGESAVEFFFGENEKAFFALRLLVVALLIWGSQQDLTTVFGFLDFTMGLLAFVNLLALALLYKVVMRLLKDFESHLNAGNDTPVLDPDNFSDLNIDTQAWKK